ncbi:MAG: hypothetical protein WCZ19_01480 [Acholeplasma sp.]
MKKITMILLVFMLTLLVGCTTPEDRLPELNEDDKVEMTATEKAEFLQTVAQLTTEDTNNFRLDTFLDLEFAMTSELEFSFEDLSTVNDMTMTFSADFDMTNYIEIGESAEDTYMYSRFNAFELNMLNDVYMSSTNGEETTTEDVVQTVDFSLSDTYFLARNDYAYYHLNGSASVEVKVDNQVDQDLSTAQTFTNLKEKTLEERITQEMYLELMASMVELQEMLRVDFDAEMTEAEKDDMLDMLDTHVSIYSNGNEHTIQFLVNTQMIDDVINQLFESIETELGEFSDMENFDTVKTSIIAAFKSFNFDFRIILDGELEGAKTLSRIEMLITGEFSGFSLNMAEVDENSIPMIIEMTVKLNRLGFTLDFNADDLTLPTESELAEFALVDTPSFGDVFDGMFQ